MTTDFHSESNNFHSSYILSILYNPQQQMTHTDTSTVHTVYEIHFFRFIGGEQVENRVSRRGRNK